MEYQHIVHTFPPVYDADSRVLILGTLPSVKSRENGFYYGHPRNRFWSVLAALFEEPVPVTIPEKQAMLLRNGVALWDVVYSCDIRGSDDSSIRNVEPTDLGTILETANIRQIYVNGSKAGELFRKYQQQRTGKSAVVLPSTSPANAAWSEERLREAWRTITELR